MELEADDLGAQYIAKEGYSPQGMFNVLSVLKDQEIYSKNQAEKGRNLEVIMVCLLVILLTISALKRYWKR